MSAPMARPGDWRPMETAPRDGTPLLLWAPHTITSGRTHVVAGLCDEYAIGFWAYGCWKSLEIEDCGSMGGEFTGWMPDWVSLDLEPFLWMPLPAPPATSPALNQPPRSLAEAERDIAINVLTKIGHGCPDPADVANATLVKINTLRGGGG